MKKVRKNTRRGQTIFLALAILFLLILLGTIFVTSLIRNLHRATRHGGTDEALTLALAGLRYAANQIHASDLGADWRPRPTETLWSTPKATNFKPVAVAGGNPLDTNNNGQLDAAELQAVDPDSQWLSDNGTFQQPFIRIPTGRGRFLLRLSYVPRFRDVTGGGNPLPQEFDRGSGMIHIESIGRPGEYAPDDPTFFADPTTNRAGTEIVGQFRKIDAYVPVGLVDQLWWVTNSTNEPGPADFGVPSFSDPAWNQTASSSPAPALFQARTVWSGGGIRSNRSLRFNGENIVRIYPARGEGVMVRGTIDVAAPGGPNPHLVVEAVDDSNDPAPGPGVYPKDDGNDNPNDDSILVTLNYDAQGINAAQNVMANQGGTTRALVMDDRKTRGEGVATFRSARDVEAPVLNQLDPTTGILRWLQLTRDSGAPVEIDDNGRTVLINTGWYGLTDTTLPKQLQAQGLYVDNVGDVQFPNDRENVKDVWLRRGNTEPATQGWVGDQYVPHSTSPAEGPSHPLAEVEFTSLPDPNNANVQVPKIKVTIYHFDQRQMNLSTAAGRRRQFYDLAPASGGANWQAGDLTKRGGHGILTEPAAPSGAYVRYFDYPSNGVLFAEGSIRVRGVVGEGQARQLTVVSGGTIYIEGDLLKGGGGSFIGLLAQDFVTLNPTAITRLQPGNQVSPPQGDPNLPGSYHFQIEPGGDFSFSLASALTLPDWSAWTAPPTKWILNVKHKALAHDETSTTQVRLQDPAGGSYDFGNNPPVIPPAQPPPYTAAAQQFYLFRAMASADYRDEASQDPVRWPESSFRYQSAGEGAYERKTFFLPGLTLQPGQDATFKFVVGAEGGVVGGEQPYLLSRMALLPEDRPLPIRVEAIVYAATQSWFIIPPPFFNDNPEDSRANFVSPSNDPTQGNGLRARGTFPRNPKNAGDPSNTPIYPYHPFYNEPLDVDIQVTGAVSEDKPASLAEQATWTSHLWMPNPDTNYNPVSLPPTNRPAFSPELRYRYDHDLRRMVRVRFTRPYAAHPTPYAEEEVAYIPGPGTAPTGVRSLPQVAAEALTNDSYIETLPVLPRLPASSVIYEGHPL